MENQSDHNQQSIAGGQGFQVNDPTAPVVQGDQNTVNIYQSAPPLAEPTVSGTPQNLPYTGVVAFVGREQELELLHEQLQQRTLRGAKLRSTECSHFKLEPSHFNPECSYFEQRSRQHTKNTIAEVNHLATVLSFEEMKQRYHNEWLLIADVAISLNNLAK
jgi:hypothetical protein